MHPLEQAQIARAQAALQSAVSDMPNKRKAADGFIEVAKEIMLQPRAGMARAAFENKTEFFLFDSLNAQKLYNCARNLEIASWRLNHSRDGAGELFLLSNDLDGVSRNLSFEREMGRMIALLDFLALVMEDKTGRTVNQVAQNLATAVFLPVAALSPIK